MADLQELIATVDQLSAEDLRKLSMHIKERADLVTTSVHIVPPENLARIAEIMKPVQDAAAQMSEEKVFAVLDEALAEVRETVFDLSSLSQPSENIFGIVAPETYRCIIDTYFIGHSRLMIRVVNNGQKSLRRSDFYLNFGLVQYYSGPMSWNNANFCLLSKKENAELYAQLYRDLKISADEFPEYLPGLVAVNNGSFLIKIIAPVVTMSNKPLL